jgi:NADH:ubiquinone oxidoreductase subunit 2 (subunit N)
MKKLVLFLLLISATFSLSSFGIVSNPRIADQQMKAGKSMAINSKSTVNTNSLLLNPLLEKTINNQSETKEESQKGFLKSLFGFIVSALSEIVLILISK